MAILIYNNLFSFSVFALFAHGAKKHSKKVTLFQKIKKFTKKK